MQSSTSKATAVSNRAQSPRAIELVEHPGAHQGKADLPIFTPITFAAIDIPRCIRRNTNSLNATATFTGRGAGSVLGHVHSERSTEVEAHDLLSTFLE
jgi:hypothetical protein